MIKKEKDGTISLYCHDWTPEMMALASVLYTLPLKAGRTMYDHEFAIDRIASETKYGAVAIELLHEHFDELSYCPNEEELLYAANSMLVTIGQLELVIRQVSRDRRHKAGRPKLKVSNGPIGFVRRK
jgi:hypothetical protein